MPEVATSIPPELKSYFDSLRVLGLDEEGMNKRFPVIEVHGMKFNLGDHIFRNLLFDRLADIALEESIPDSEKKIFIEGYLDAIYTTIRSMVESLGTNLDAETESALSNGFVLLKDDIYEALELHPAGTATVKVLGKFNLRAKGASGQ